MRKRNCSFLVRLNDAELAHLDRLVKRSGCSRETFVRSLIKGVVPADKPPPDYQSMMKELHAIGTNLNQIARKANTLDVVDVARYDTEVRKLTEAIKEIVNSVKSPRSL